SPVAGTIQGRTVGAGLLERLNKTRLLRTIKLRTSEYKKGRPGGLPCLITLHFFHFPHFFHYSHYSHCLSALQLTSSLASISACCGSCSTSPRDRSSSAWRGCTPPAHAPWRRCRGPSSPPSARTARRCRVPSPASSAAPGSRC